MYDLAIIGGGPAGVAAGVYASRKKLKTVIIAEEIGGQSTVSSEIQNWIGSPSISGGDLAKSFRKHLEAYAEDSLDIKEKERVESITKTSTGNFLLKTRKNEYEAKAILIAAGSTRKKLDITGAAEFENRGISYCATCDAPLFEGKDVAVIGGGNAAFETAVQLLAYAKNITILNRSDQFRADPVTVKKLLSNPKIKAAKNAQPTEIKGGKFVSSIIYLDKKTGEKKELPVEGIFVEIGLLPSTDFLSKLVDKNELGQIITDPRTQKTSAEGIWAAGDCTDGLYHQNNIAAGDAVKALEDIYNYLRVK